MAAMAGAMPRWSGPVNPQARRVRTAGAMVAGVAVLQAAPYPIAAVPVVLIKRTAVDRVAVVVHPPAAEDVILKMAVAPDAGAENMRMTTWTFSPGWIPLFCRRLNQFSFQD